VRVASAGLGESRNSVLDDRISFVTVAINSFLMLVLKNHDQAFFRNLNAAGSFLNVSCATFYSLSTHKSDSEILFTRIVLEGGN